MDLIPRKFYLDDLFDNFLASKGSENMKCDIYEKNGNYHIEMDIPGFKKDEVSIDVKNGYLNITASKKEEEEEKDKNYIRRERTYGEYTRSIYLGDVDASTIKAEFKNGTLKITVPQQEKSEDKTVIQIEE